MDSTPRLDRFLEESYFSGPKMLFDGAMAVKSTNATLPFKQVIRGLLRLPVFHPTVSDKISRHNQMMARFFAFGHGDDESDQS